MTGFGIAVTGHAVDIGSQGRDVKRRTCRDRGDRVRRPANERDRDPASEPAFQRRERRRRRTAQRRLDGSDGRQTPVRRRVRASLGRQPAQRLESQRRRVFARPPRFEHCLRQGAKAARPHEFEMAEAGPAEELRPRRIAGERRGKRLSHPLALARRVERGEIDDNPAADLAQPQLARDHPGRREIGATSRAFGRAGFRAAGIDIDQHRRRASSIWIAPPSGSITLGESALSNRPSRSNGQSAIG